MKIANLDTRPSNSKVQAGLEFEKADISYSSED